MYGSEAGESEVQAAAADLAARIPEPLAPLARIAYNYVWSWLGGGHELFRSVDADRFEACNRNPVRLLREASGRSLNRAAQDADVLARAAEMEARIKAHLERPADTGVIEADRPAVFLCAEYAVHESLPVYSGGLGALAGDFLKEASDLALPFVAVGLMYRKGYFRQRIDITGWQHEYWVDTDPELVPAALVRRADGSQLTITVPIYDDEVEAQIWRVDVGRVPLYLLDTNLPGNLPMQRWITARLYESDRDIRLSQYMLLGVGGVRALQAMGIEPGVLHLNEGHAALAPLELALSEVRKGEPVETALAASRAHTVFTTHTPVPAGNDSYPREQAARAFELLSKQSSIDERDLIALGQTRAHEQFEPFGVTQAALRMTRAANGVSRRHGQVAREMWTALWPDLPVGKIPIGHVTNGVHVPSWIGPHMRALLSRHLGEDWLTRAGDAKTWAPVAKIPDAELWAAREKQRAELIEVVRVRSAAERLQRGDTMDWAMAAANAMDPKLLTVGFARRLATYKRLDLLTREAQWAAELLSGDRPMQLLMAGKAHPHDDDGKRVLQRLFSIRSLRSVIERVVFLDDYDLATAQILVRGCDVWLNLPRPPLEASGTSGMKSVVNGGLQLSVLDGWWAEAYDETNPNGWAISGDVEQDAHAQDERDAATLHSLLANEVMPAFYERDRNGIPARWLEMVRQSLMTLGPQFSSMRMVRDYVRGPYSGWRD
ncbi:MAG: alpha-glucan family phosphorylase [Solirubrobacteraceae bacterium]